MKKGMAGLSLVVGLVGGVSCQSAPAKPQGTPQVRMHELPEEYRTLWRSWLRQDPRYEDLREEALADPRRAIFLVENLVATMLGELTAGRIDSQDPERPTLYARAQKELVEIGPHSAPALAEVLPLGLGMGPVAAGELLVKIGAPSVPPLLEQLARTDHPVARRRAAKALGDMAQSGIPPGADAQAVRAALGAGLKGDPDWIVRSQCALALGPWGKRSVHEMNHSASFLIAGLRDGDEGVRTDVVHGLARLGDPRTFPALIDHLARSEAAGDVSMTMLTQAALVAMTRKRDVRTPHGWRAWWRDARPGIMQRFLDQTKRTAPER